MALPPTSADPALSVPMEAPRVEEHHYHTLERYNSLKNAAFRRMMDSIISPALDHPSPRMIGLLNHDPTMR